MNFDDAYTEALKQYEGKTIAEREAFINGVKFVIEYDKQRERISQAELKEHFLDTYEST